MLILKITTARPRVTLRIVRSINPRRTRKLFGNTIFFDSYEMTGARGSWIREKGKMTKRLESNLPELAVRRDQSPFQAEGDLLGESDRVAEGRMKAAQNRPRDHP